MAARGRPASNKDVIQDKVDGYSFDFRKFSQDIPFMNGYNPATGSGFYQNPIWMNSILKQVSGLPAKYERERVIEYLTNPIFCEKALKDLAQWMYVNTQHFQRIVNYFATILDFRYYVYPTNATSEKDFNSPAYKKSLKVVHDFLNRFNIKQEFGKAMFVSCLEDTGFWYLREDKEHISLQRMPTDYSLIVNHGFLGYIYSFNMVYFLTPGVSLSNFAPEFAFYYREFLLGTHSIPFYWKELEPDKGIVFKWNENFAGNLPPLLGLYLDTLEIQNYKDLVKTRSVLDNWKILFQKIPIKVDKDAKKNDYLIDKDSAQNYHSNIKNNLPPQTSLVTSPMDVTAIDTAGNGNVQTRNNLGSIGSYNFYSSCGVNPQIFGSADKVGNVGIKLGTQNDISYMLHMYRQFEAFINNQLSKRSGTYQFKIEFIDGSMYNQEEQVTRYLKMAQVGFPATLVAAAGGLNPIQFHQLTMMEKATNLKENLTPLQTSYTMPGVSKEAGAPKKADADLSDSGDSTRSNGDNEEKINK